jgi:hypothetical protein
MSRPNGGATRVLEVFSLEELKPSFVAENKLGRGGYGTVFKAAVPGRGDVAVKRLRLGDDPHNAQVRHHTCCGGRPALGPSCKGRHCAAVL